MYLDVYIGFFDDYFQWENQSTEGKAPKRRSPFFPSGYEAFRELKRRIADGEYVGKPVDWGAWVAKVNKQQIFDFISFLYPPDKDWEESLYAHLKHDYLELLAFVDALDNDTEYALTASEL